MPNSRSNTKTLRVILGDQLSDSISSLNDATPDNDTILMMEVMEEATYVEHHQLKLVYTFSCMRHFSQHLVKKGFKVIYLELTDPKNKQSFPKNIIEVFKKFKFQEVIVTEASEYRVTQMFTKLQQQLPLQILEDDRFYISKNDFQSWARSQKQLRMENFYRMMRKQTGILMQNSKPVGGKWNFDSENRTPPKSGLTFRKPSKYKIDSTTQAVIKMVTKKFSQNMGDAKEFNLAVTRRSAKIQLNNFIKHHLPEFGTYQDAMLTGEYYLNHSNLSMHINSGLLTAKEVVAAVEKAFKEDQIPLNSIEGFIRQILGWREYVRGVYWLYMPEYADRNTLKLKNNLPSFYWTGKTDLNCLQHVIKQTLETATSHHIQRLMITGNFALLIGALPKQVCDWYLAVYADAYDWVELPNTLGMALYSDGGIMGSKPYVASGNYINKMSNFCGDCVYDVKAKDSEAA